MRKSSKTFYRRFMLLLVALSVISITVYFSMKSLGVNAETSLIHKVALDNTIPSEGGVKGSDSNPFVILEIVSNEQFSEFGYLIDGCEPVDVDEMLLQNDPTIKDLALSGAATVTEVETTKFELDQADILTEWTKVEDKTVTKTGYYERVEAGTGNYVQQIVEEVIDPETTVKTIVNANYVKQELGDFVWVTVEDLDPTLNVTNHNAINIGDKVYTTRTDIYYSKVTGYTYTNNNLFLKNSLNLTEDEIKKYHVVIRTIQPDELNNHLEWIDRADLVSISPESNSDKLRSIWADYNLEKKPSTTNQALLNFENAQDLTWATSMALFNKVVVDDDYAAIIIDNKTYETTSLLKTVSNNVTTTQFGYTSDGIERSYNNSPLAATNNNMYKFCLMLRTMDPLVFYNLYLNKTGSSTTSFINTTTGSYTKQPSAVAQTYWNRYTFMPTKLDGTKAGNSDWDTGECWQLYRTNPDFSNGSATVSGRVYTYKGQVNKGIVDTFLDTGYIAEGKYTQDLFDSFTDSSITVTSPAEAIEYILGYKGSSVNQKDTITILDLEPSNVFNKTPRAFQLMMPRFSGKINIVQQTTATFNGKIEDLNKVYDMIYLGLNYNNSVYTLVNINDKSNGGWPDYNDNKLDGMVYLHVGDEIIGATDEIKEHYPIDWLKNGDNKDECRLPGNDITKLKQADLQEFVSAGYPVVVEKNLFDLNQDRIDTTSYIYDLVAKNKGTVEGNLMSEAEINRAPDKMLIDSLDKIKPLITLLAGPKEYSGSEAAVLSADNSLYINGSNINYKTLSFKFTISDNTNDSNQKYDLYLFVDKNADGKFSVETEKIITKKGYKTGTYSYSKNLGDSFVGAIPWKLAIVSQTDSLVRSEVTGICAIKKKNIEKETIRVLQVTSSGTGGDKSNLNLQTSGVFKTYTDNLNDFKIVFKTINTTQFENLYNGKKFLNSNKIGTDLLTTNYDMLIFGFSDMYTNISNANGAIYNIQYFIDIGKSVLFTHDVTSFNNKTYAGSTNQFGYNFNRMFRSYLSMDRFGARVGNGDVVATADAKIRDKATIANGNGIATYDAIHGYTSWALRRIGSKVSATKNPIPIYPGFTYNDANYETRTVSQLNKGQITSYPYLISQDFKCAPTHPQYFQLDLEDDNVVVWYCLAVDKELEKWQDRSNGVSYYSKSPNDALNNYYIYNKGNITYTGVGHSEVKDIEEVKLFINTMVAAYRSIPDPPSVEITNEDSYKKSYEQSYVYMNADELTDTYEADDNMKINFIPYDSSLLSPQLSVKVKTEDGIAFSIYDEDENLVVPSADGYVSLNTDNEYFINWPKAYVSTLTKRKLIFTIMNSKGQGSIHNVQVIRRNYFNLD